MKINRRDLLKMGAGAGVAMAAGGGVWGWSRPARVANDLEPGVEKWIPTICGQCMGGCGLLVRVVDGWAVNIAGNPLHPVNRGTLCPRGIAGLQGLYDPDRIRSPLKRVGNRGEGRWQPISWDEALKLVSESLKDLREKKDPHLFSLLSGRYRGLMKSLWERFLEAFGSPNRIENEFRWEDSPIEGLYLTQGVYGTTAYDVENAHYLLSFGCDLLESSSPGQSLGAYGRFRRGRPEHRGRLIQIEPRLSITAIKADEWIPTQPGTEPLVALAIANMIIREGLYNKEFVSNRTFGFENWKDPNGMEHPGFKEIVLSDYEPNRVSRTTGVPIDTIIRLAREFATNPPALALGRRGRPFEQMAVSVLNGLVGSIDVPGGVLVPAAVPLENFPPLARDAVAQKGLATERIDGGTKKPMMTNRPYLFARNVISGKPYKPKVLFLYYTNPLFSNPQSNLFARAFSEIPLIVSFSPYMDDSTRFADLVLPDHTPLERWQDDPLFLNNGCAVLGLRQPVVEPLYQTKHTGDVILALAKSVGGEIEEAFPWKNFDEVLHYGIKGVFDAKRGDTFGLPFDQAWTRLLERGGWWSPSYRTPEEFWKLLQEKGGWWDPVYDFHQWDRVVKTPSKKFEFLAQAIKDHPAIASLGVKASSLFPHWEEPKETGDEKTYPFRLHLFRPMPLAGSRNANQPWLQAIAGGHLFERWETWAEISPETADRIGVKDRDMIWVESPHGKIAVRARVYKGAMPDVLSIPFGSGHLSGGRWAQGIGQNPGVLLPDRLDPLTGDPIKDPVRIKVYKA